MSIVTDVQLIINDTNVFWPLATVLDAVNEAQFWVWSFTKWSRVSAALPLTHGEDIISLPSTILVPGWIEGAIVNSDSTVSHLRMFPTSQRELETFLRTWRGVQLDQPQFFAVWDATHLRVFPRPDKTYNFTVWGLGWPAEIFDASTVLSAPARVYQAIKHYSVGLLLEATRPDLADVYYSLAEDDTLAYKRQMRNQQPHNIRRLRPATWFDLQQSGTIRQLPTYYPLEA